MHPLQPAVAFPVQSPQQVGVNVDLVFPLRLGQAPCRRMIARTVLRLSWNCRLISCRGVPARCNW